MVGEETAEVTAARDGREGAVLHHVGEERLEECELVLAERMVLEQHGLAVHEELVHHVDHCEELLVARAKHEAELGRRQWITERPALSGLALGPHLRRPTQSPKRVEVLVSPRAWERYRCRVPLWHLLAHTGRWRTTTHHGR